jgi:hypothetical protein
VVSISSRQPAYAVQDVLRLFVSRLSGLRHRELAGGAVQEARPELFLKLCYIFRHQRL